VILIVALYLALELPTLGTFGMLWDEQNDLDVARSYVSAPAGWLAGSAEDPTQMRLPMYTTAVALATTGRHDVQTARLVSCAVSTLTLIGIYYYARRWLGRPQAQLAAAALATSPLFLAFSRVALTEGDAFVTAAVAWCIVTLALSLERPTVGRATLCGVCLGLAVSSKFVAIALTPAFILAPLWTAPAQQEASRARRDGVAVGLALGGMAIVACLLGWLYWYRPRMPEQAVLTGTVWLVGAAACGLSLLYMARHRRDPVGRVAHALLPLGVAGAVFLLIPPVHLTSPVLLGSLKRQMVRSTGVDFVMMVQGVSLHFLTLLFKPSLTVGLLVFVGVVFAAFRWAVHTRADWRVGLPLLCIAAYAAFLVKMLVAQTFYTLPVFPWMLVLAADRLVALSRRQRLVAAAAVLACAASVAVDLRLTYPHYELNGYQWLGARYVLGLSTVSYRSVVQINSDGVQQALEWIQEHVPSGATVKTYIKPDHIVRAICPAPRFAMVDGLRPPSPSVGATDYVVTTLLAELRRNHPAGLRGSGSVFDYPYDRAALVRNYEPVFQVQRPFGLVFATVWRRK